MLAAKLPSLSLKNCGREEQSGRAREKRTGALPTALTATLDSAQKRAKRSRSSSLRVPHRSTRELEKTGPAEAES
jgi:hypothetical protein